MLSYRAAHTHVEGGVHGEVLDSPGVVTCGTDLEAVRRLLASALVDMAETCLENGEVLPLPNPTVTDPDAALEEPIHLLVTAASRVAVVPQGTTA